MNRWTLGGIALSLLAVGGAAVALQNETASPEPAETPAPTPAPTPTPQAASPQGERAAPPPVAGKATPMAERVAVVGLLNKRNGISRDLTMKPGQALRVGDIIVRLRACETTAPWETQKLTGAFVQVDHQGVDNKWRRVFSGWLYKESPSLNVVEHPVYDVWPKSCTMTWPEIGPETTRASAGSRSGGAAPARASSAPKSAPEAPAEASPTESAAPSNPT
jgi:hypothetical protein